MRVELLTREPDSSLPEGQAQTFQLLLELAADDRRYTLQEVIQRSNLPSPLPFWSRLRHLEAKGLIKMSHPVSRMTSALVEA